MAGGGGGREGLAAGSNNRWMMPYFLFILFFWCTFRADPQHYFWFYWIGRWRFCVFHFGTWWWWWWPPGETRKIWIYSKENQKKGADHPPATPLVCCRRPWWVTRDPLVFHRDDDDDDDNNPIGVIFFSFQNKIYQTVDSAAGCTKKTTPFWRSRNSCCFIQFKFGCSPPPLSLLLSSSSALCVCARVTFANRDRSGLVGRLFLVYFLPFKCSSAGVVWRKQNYRSRVTLAEKRDSPPPGDLKQQIKLSWD